MDKKQNTLLKNTVMLYALTFSNYLFSFITVPFQTRILGPEAFGEIGFAQAMMVYVQLALDFGFILSSTEDVARNRDNPAEMSRIMTAVLVCKLALGLVSFGAVTGLCLTVERFRENMLLFQLFFLSTFVNCLLPDFLYRGMEKMSAITYRAVAVKAFFTGAVFLLLRSREQVWLIPLLNTLGGVGACLWTYLDMDKNCGVRLVKVEAGYVWGTLRRSASYFVSRIASTVYSATNTVIVGFLYPAGSTLGCYSSAERLMTTARSAFSPIADSLYPYMVNNRDYKLVKKILLALMPLILAGCAVVGVFAEEFCVLLFGEEFAGTGHLLRLLMPVVAISLPTYVCGFPMLSPLGLGKFANYSVVAGAVFHAAALLALYGLGLLNVESVCVTTCVTETLVLAIRVAVMVFRKKILKEKE